MMASGIALKSCPFADLSSAGSVIIGVAIVSFAWSVNDYLNESKKSKKTYGGQFSCTQCGSKLEVFTPDDIHTIASRTESNNSVLVKNVCKNCSIENAIYWQKTNA